MKITLNIDDGLLARVMTATGINSKTKAIDFALREIDRRHELKRMLSTNLGFTEKEIINAFDTSYDVMGLRVAETPGASSEPTPPQKPVNYVTALKKSRSRR